MTKMEAPIRFTKRFTEEHLSKLRVVYALVKTINPNRLHEFHQIFDTCNDEALDQLVKAKIKFVSKLARNAQLRRSEQNT